MMLIHKDEQIFVSAQNVFRVVFYFMPIEPFFLRFGIFFNKYETRLYYTI